MSGALKKVLGILAILLVGMLLIYTVVQIFFPNLMTSMVGAVETSIKNATSFDIDINGDGNIGTPDTKVSMDEHSEDTYTGDHIAGWDGEGGADAQQ